MLLCGVGLQTVVLLAIDWLAVRIQIPREQRCLAFLWYVVLDVAHAVHRHFWLAHIIRMNQSRLLLRQHFMRPLGVILFALRAFLIRSNRLAIACYFLNLINKLPIFPIGVVEDLLMMLVENAFANFVFALSLLL